MIERVSEFVSSLFYGCVNKDGDYCAYIYDQVCSITFVAISVITVSACIYLYISIFERRHDINSR